MFYRAGLIFVFLSILLFCTCCNKKAFDLSDYQNSYLIFGQGGGITGLRIEYVLIGNGSLYRRDATSGSLTFIKNTGRAFANQSLKNYSSLGLDTITCYEPGDLYYYVERHTPDDTHRLVWGRPGFAPPEIIVTYFNNLYRTAKKTDE